MEAVIKHSAVLGLEVKTSKAIPVTGFEGP
jgi:hypothetical protein